MFDAAAHRNLTEAQARYWEDEAHQRGKRGELLEFLLDGDWHPNHDIVAITLSFHSVIYALRREGWLIESRHKCGGTWEYRITGKTEPPPPTLRMSPSQRRIARVYSDAITGQLGDDALEQVVEEIPDWMRLPAPTLASNAEAARRSPGVFIDGSELVEATV